MSEAILHNESPAVDVIAPSGGYTSGEVLQLCDGRAAYVQGLRDPAANEAVSLQTEGQVKLTKLATKSVLDGGKLYWDRSAGSATPIKTADSFYLGVAVGDAAQAATTVICALNVQPAYAIELGKGPWVSAASNGEGVSLVSLAGSELKLSFDAVAEVAMAAIYSGDTVPCADGPILEAQVAIYDIGDNAALDINVGLANATHATDFDQVTEAVAIHLDGNSLAINAESDDGTTEVAATDTTKVAVDDTYFEVWIDCRDIDDIQIYIDGVNVLPATVFKLDAATGPLLAIAHIEKTSNDTTADVRVKSMTVRTTDLT